MRNTTEGKFERIWLVVFICSLVVVAAMQLWMITEPFTGDERGNQDVSYRLATEGRYATKVVDNPAPRGEPRGVEFDGYVTTGPTVLVPVALVYRVFGVGNAQGRSVMLVYYICSIFAFYALAGRLFDKNAARIAASIFATFPAVVEMGHRVAGEMAALLFIFLGVYALLVHQQRRSWLLLILAGLLAGLAGLTKVLAFIVPFGVFVWFAGWVVVYLNKRSFGLAFRGICEAVVYSLFAALPTLLYFVVIVWRVGWQGLWDNYLSYTAGFFTSAGDTSALGVVLRFLPKPSWITYVANNQAIVVLGVVSCLYYAFLKNKRARDFLLIILTCAAFWFAGGMYRPSIYFSCFLILIVGKFIGDLSRSGEGRILDFSRPASIAVILCLALIVVNVLYDIRFIYLGEPGHELWFEITNHSLRVPFWNLLGR